MNGLRSVATGKREASDGLTPFASGAIRAGVARGLTVISLFVCAASALAADDAKIIYPSGSQATPAPSGGGVGVANTLTLVVAIACAAVGGWLYWRNRRTPGMGRDGRALAVEETRSLGNRQYLVVASYEGKKFLLGVCPGRIDMLAPLNERREGDSAR